MTNHEIDTRVPLIVRAPGVRPGICHGLVESVDIYPTVCELTGVERSAELEGRSLVPLLRAPGRRGKSAVFSQYLRDGIWVAPDGVPYMGYAIRTKRHRYVEWKTWPEGRLVARELYDLRLDPREDVNVAERPEARAVMAELAARLQKGWRGERM